MIHKGGGDAMFGSTPLRLFGSGDLGTSPDAGSDGDDGTERGFSRRLKSVVRCCTLSYAKARVQGREATAHADSLV